MNFCLGAIIGAGSLFVPVAIISVLTKLVERNETGKMQDFCQ